MWFCFTNVTRPQDGGILYKESRQICGAYDMRIITMQSLITSLDTYEINRSKEMTNAGSNT